MAQSNHRRPGIPAGDEKRVACRTSGNERHPRRDLSAFARCSIGPTSLPVTAIEPRNVGVRVCVGQARR